MIAHVIQSPAMLLDAQRHILLHLARASQKRGDNWRKANYGCAALGIMSDKTLHYFVGANHKKARGPRQACDLCAEMEAIDEARAKSCRKLLCMLVYGPPEKDDKTGVDFGGGKPSCMYCRTRFRREIVDPRSPVKLDTHMIFVSKADPSKQAEMPMGDMLVQMDGYLFMPPLQLVGASTPWFMP